MNAEVGRLSSYLPLAYKESNIAYHHLTASRVLCVRARLDFRIALVLKGRKIWKTTKERSGWV